MLCCRARFKASRAESDGWEVGGEEALTSSGDTLTMESVLGEGSRGGVRWQPEAARRIMSPFSDGVMAMEELRGRQEAESSFGGGATGLNWKRNKVRVKFRVTEEGRREDLRWQG